MIQLREDITESETMIPVDGLEFPIGPARAYRLEVTDLWALGDPPEVVWVTGIIEGDEPAVVVHRGVMGRDVHPGWGIVRPRKKGDKFQPVVGFDYLADDIYWRYGPMEAQWTPVAKRTTREVCYEGECWDSLTIVPYGEVSQSG